MRGGGVSSQETRVRWCWLGVIGRRLVFEKKAKLAKRPPQTLANVPSVWLRMPHRHSTSLSPGSSQLFAIRCTLEDPLSHRRRRP